MSKSATVLGQLYGVTGQVMNVILKELGYLEGDPGAYGVTEKGAKYAYEKDHHRGPGGYSWYNRDWTTRTWDDGIVDELHVTDDIKHKAQEAVSAARWRVAAAVADDIGAGSDAVADNAADATGNGRRVAVVAAGVAFLAGSAYGIYKAAPHAKKLLDEKVVPGLMNIKDKMLRKSDKDHGSEPVAVDALSGRLAAPEGPGCVRIETVILATTGTTHRDQKSVARQAYTSQVAQTCEYVDLLVTRSFALGVESSGSGRCRFQDRLLVKC